MSFLIVSAAIGAGSALYGVGKSISQSSKAHSIDANNARPTYTIPDEYKQNVAMAKHMAQIGLPQQQYNNQLNGILGSQASAIGSLSNSANPGANLAAIVRQGDAATGNLNASDAAARQNNQRYAIGQNAQLGQQQLAAQQYNKFDKYTENYNESAALKGAASQNMQNGINGAAKMAGTLYGTNFSNGVAKPQTSGQAPDTWGAPPYQVPATGAFSYGQAPDSAVLGWGAMMHPQETNLSQEQQSPFNNYNFFQRR